MYFEVLNRRKFFKTMAGIGFGIPFMRNPRIPASKTRPKTNRPLIVTSKTNAFVREKITTMAWEVLKNGGSVLDAAEKATNISELDPRDSSVGYGGDPNEEGFLQLDASVMSGPDNNNAGAVAALENIKTPCSVARLVMERTDHLLLVGKGALKFAKMHGWKFKHSGLFRFAFIDNADISFRIRNFYFFSVKSLFYAVGYV